MLHVLLPPGISRSEQVHLDRVNRRARRVLAAAVPVVAALAWCNQTGALLAVELSLAVVALPWVASRAATSPRLVSLANGIAAMGVAALLVHFGRGPLAVEMHVAFFVVLAMLVVFGNPLVILVAAAAAALFPLLDDAAPAGVIGLHLGFLALETAACCLVARSFFDDLVSLEKTARTRTVELERKTRDLELFLDTVDQGFVTLTEGGAIVASSAAFARSFEGDRTDTFFDRLEAKDPSFAADSRAAWEQVAADVLPGPLALAQMPARLVTGDHVYRFLYRAVDATTTHPATSRLFIAVVSDVTSELARETAETEKREGLLLVQRVLTERTTVTSFLAEGRRIVEQLAMGADVTTARRGLHTLKGNASVLGITSIADVCHALETRLAAPPGRLATEDVAPVAARFRALEAMLTPLLEADRAHGGLREDELARLETLVQRGTDADARASVVAALAELRREPVQPQLDHLGEHARDLALRLGRAPLAVTVEAHDARMNAHDSGTFWAAFVHLVHNAVDHGIETETERRAGGKGPVAQLHLRAGEERGSVFVEIEDDGRGIDWERVVARARELGLPALASRQDALFADGVSTAAHIDDLSGRGIGMGAVRAAVHGLHGDLTVHSSAGKGTRIRATIPLA